MIAEQISLLHVGAHLMPDGLPEDVAVGSAIKLIEVQEKGFRFRRIHLYYNGEEFFLTKEALIKTQWIFVPIGMQLVLF